MCKGTFRHVGVCPFEQEEISVGDRFIFLFPVFAFLLLNFDLLSNVAQQSTVYFFFRGGFLNQVIFAELVVREYVCR